MKLQPKNTKLRLGLTEKEKLLGALQAHLEWLKAENDHMEQVIAQMREAQNECGDVAKCLQDLTKKFQELVK